MWFHSIEPITYLYGRVKAVYFKLNDFNRDAKRSLNLLWVGACRYGVSNVYVCLSCVQMGVSCIIVSNINRLVEWWNLEPFIGSVCLVCLCVCLYGYFEESSVT